MRLTIHLLTVFFFCCALKAQENPSKIQAGYQLSLQYNLYNRFEYPKAPLNNLVAQGQVLNVLPGLGWAWWIAQPEKWWLSLHTAVEYSPFSFDLEQQTGLGLLNFPLSVQLQWPVARQKSLWCMMHIGLGTELFFGSIYQKGSLQTIHNSIFAELGCHVAAFGSRHQQFKDIGIFVRYGMGPQGEKSLNVGLKLQLWHWFKKNKIKLIF